MVLGEVLPYGYHILRKVKRLESSTSTARYRYRYLVPTCYSSSFMELGQNCQNKNIQKQIPTPTVPVSSTMTHMRTCEIRGGKIISKNIRGWQEDN